MNDHHMDDHHMDDHQTNDEMPVAIIAGSGGAGMACALAFAAAGYSVVTLDARAEAARTAADVVEAAGGQADAFGVDLLDTEAVCRLRQVILDRHGRVDVVVHLVGGWRGTRTLDLDSVANWQALNPPIVGTLAVLTAVFGPDVRDSPIGRAFMITSTAASAPTAGNIAYAAAKAAAEAWMGGVSHFLHDSKAASVVIAVKALLTEQMRAEQPDRDWTGYTHVNDLAAAILLASTGPARNGSRIDLTRGYSKT